MFGANSPNAIRMLQQLYTLNTPPPAPAPRGRPAPKRETIRHVREPSVSSSESESDTMSQSEASTSSYESYDEPEVIYTKIVKEKKCPYVSPAGLASKKTKKEAVKYLKEKGCPDTESLRKPKTEPVPQVEADEMFKAAAPATNLNTKPEIAAKKTKKAAAAAAPVVEVKVAEVKAPEVKAPVANTVGYAPTEKPKRELSAYQKFVQEQRKAGKSMTEAAAAWKALKA